MIRKTLLAVVCLAAAGIAAPPLTTIQDVLYKADGTRFNGTLTISWNSFQAVDNSSIVTQSTTVKVVEGNLRVQLVPTTTSTPPVYYSVTYHSDGRVQFQETWAVPSSALPLRIRDVRSAAPLVAADTGGGTGGGPVQESDVVGLVADLAARPLKGPGLAAGRVAYVNPLGALDSVSGGPTDCVHVDGSSGPCGSTGQAPAFVDADSPAGIVDGANVSFALSGVPNPDTSLALYRNGVLQKAGQDYSANGNAITFAAGAVPQPGDTLLASYRLTANDNSIPQMFPAPQVLCSGTGSSVNGTALASIGGCSIPAGLLTAGDRIEIKFDLSHQGAGSGFSFEVDWGATAILQRDAAASDALVTGRADAGILPVGAQLSSQSWGTVLALNGTVANASDDYSGGIAIRFLGKLAGAGDSDSLTLTNYTVVRLP